VKSGITVQLDDRLAMVSARRSRHTWNAPRFLRPQCLLHGTRWEHCECGVWARSSCPSRSIVTETAYVRGPTDAHGAPRVHALLPYPAHTPSSQRPDAPRPAPAGWTGDWTPESVMHLCRYPGINMIEIINSSWHASLLTPSPSDGHAPCKVDCRRNLHLATAQQPRRNVDCTDKVRPVAIRARSSSADFVGFHRKCRRREQIPPTNATGKELGCPTRCGRRFRR